MNNFVEGIRTKSEEVWATVAFDQIGENIELDNMIHMLLIGGYNIRIKHKSDAYKLPDRYMIDITGKRKKGEYY
jgi:hypothetical protein